VIFHWFGAQTSVITGARTGGCQHGFAHISPWAVTSASVRGDSLLLRLSLAPNEASRAARVDFLDKTDGFKRKTQETERIEIHGERDRPYLNTTNTVTIIDAGEKRRIVVAKTGSETTVV
jgi:D-hexose-6-phosphate mutarotase